ncbi:MAG: response regulator [Gammaproteobacteria bacterium]
MMMKVLLIDDHALFRAGLVGLLERRGIEIAGAVGDPREGLRCAQELAPDVILLDVRMPEMSGLQVLRELRESGNEAPVVMLTTSSDKEDLMDSLRYGVRGYLLKDMAPDELVAALRQIVAGKMVVAPELSSALAEAVQQSEGGALEPGPSPFEKLTPRELEILCHLSEGQSNKIIARNLDITDGTVKLHVKAILRKLGVQSRVEAAVMAVEHRVCDKAG